jgi:hypothetical protein
MRLLPGNPDILTPEYQMDYISVSQHFSTLSPSGFACQHGALQAPSQHFSESFRGLAESVGPDRRW